MKSLELLLQTTSGVVMTPEQKEEQRRSFAYGNTKLENDRITRETIAVAAKGLDEERQEVLA